jgi:hypothetical protein
MKVVVVNVELKFTLHRIKYLDIKVYPKKHKHNTENKCWGNGWGLHLKHRQMEHYPEVTTGPLYNEEVLRSPLHSPKGMEEE